MKNLSTALKRFSNKLLWILNCNKRKFGFKMNKFLLIRK